ncbi:Spy/CpxP family protein refolding chaperone [Gracilimonas sp. Q87]|uniref:Spy/CpxP family protein refolding chaperone n=1 Tax=Gracilimonas sp. Q87 TaxID=3384766 RepID=UPI0039845346
MDISKKYKWALSGLIIMVVLNAVILVTVWMDHNDGRDWHKHKDNDHDRNSSQQFMKNELDLTDEQSDKISALRREHFGEIRSIKKELDQTRRSYLNYILMNEDHDTEMRDSLVNTLTQGYAEIEESLYVHMQDIREILNDEQAEQFKEFMQQHSQQDNKRKKRNGRD